MSGAELGSLQRSLPPKPLYDSINKDKRQICQDAVTSHMEVQEMWLKVCLILTSLELSGNPREGQKPKGRQKQHLGSRGSHVVTSNGPMPK